MISSDFLIFLEVSWHLGQDSFFCAHMALCGLPGAVAFLTAPPVNDGREIDSPLFQIVLKRRLRVPTSDTEYHCPRCGEIMDNWGDHALTCSYAGDRTIRHNAIRNICYEEAEEAGLRPEREKAGLLPELPQEDGLPIAPSARRPADIWVPWGSSGKGEALDFAVSSGLQSNLFHPVAETPRFVFDRYEGMKRGFKFIPLVLEAHGGGWSPLLRATVDYIARLQAASQYEVSSMVSLKIAQCISCTLHRENARAILRRTAGPSDSSSLPSGWDESINMET